ncbi:thioredoxin [Frondihabitans peucedani]|jgi:thiol-disulfide isomerase/thioredoxin|uniref:Glutaredoxin n=1 Tax=Frondihabitans peucedani TaxID=598626 RepID=A0ABP8E3S9_9MICO
MRLELYTSAFCGACHAARAAVGDAERLVPGLEHVDVDVATDPDRAEARDIVSTPTIVLTDDEGSELFRAAGAPTVPQLLHAIAAHLPAA